jgi:hypothetical protein
MGRARGRRRELPYEAVLGQEVIIRENGRERRVTAAEAFLLQLTKLGLDGDSAAARAAIAAIGDIRDTDLSVPYLRAIIHCCVDLASVSSAVERLRIGTKLDRYRQLYDSAACLQAALLKQFRTLIAPDCYHHKAKKAPPARLGGTIAHGSWLCENSSARRAGRNISKKLRIMESNDAARAMFDTLLENCIFYISPMYEFLHSQGLGRVKTLWDLEKCRFW